ncbi:hypothetical protein [Rubrimonas cliftonensis]|uniref:Capsular polysaccharide export protein n=1 Tax=Rubrimonas cliftonensis TaxID=89524 RepID=A0A1H3WNQ6_9RHOB|nr:hypothetical protein [Rubrimonas cliftonensis]SDZ88411.1 capsular polysaccharide export protein [Rubrimonas cliftonensis]
MGIEDAAVIGLRVVRLEASLMLSGWEPTRPVKGYLADALASYFDGGRPTELEAVLNAYQSGAWTEDPRAAALVARARRGEIQKYAQICGSWSGVIGPDDVVVLGQVAGDMAWLASPSAVDGNVEMVAAAAHEYPGRRVVYKPHPFNGANEAELAAIAREMPQVVTAPGAASLALLCAARPTVVVCTSNAGLEAALRGCKVVTYGLGYYAGWGFTEDRMSCARRRNTLTAEDVFAATQHLYARFFGSATLRTVDQLEAVERLSAWRDAARRQGMP